MKRVVNTYVKTKISKLKIGDLFEKEKGKKVYIYGGKVRMYNKWGDYKGWGFSYGAYDDISSYYETMSDINVTRL
jgi:serine protease inhibitor ecotin